MFAHACTCVRCAFADISSSYDLIAPGLKRQRVARVMKSSPLRYPELMNFVPCPFCYLIPTGRQESQIDKVVAAYNSPPAAPAPTPATAPAPSASLGRHAAPSKHVVTAAPQPAALSSKKIKTSRPPPPPPRPPCYTLQHRHKGFVYTSAHVHDVDEQELQSRWPSALWYWCWV